MCFTVLELILTTPWRTRYAYLCFVSLASWRPSQYFRGEWGALLRDIVDAVIARNDDAGGGECGVCQPIISTRATIVDWTRADQVVVDKGGGSIDKGRSLRR